MQEITYTALRAVYPENMPSSQKVHLLGSLSRVCDKWPGRVISNPDFSFIFTDLDGQNIGLITHVLECNGVAFSLRLISPAFFDRLFSGRPLLEAV